MTIVRARSRVGLIAILALAMSLAVGSAAQAQEQMPPRLQWNANYGYCGETSFISAGMMFGQYLSQWDARTLASPGVPQTTARSQLLLGVNDLRAAQAMRLSATRFDSSRQTSVRPFLLWVTEQFDDGNSVIIGVLNNTTILNDRGPGDPEYDHIVPVVDVQPGSPDIITISDNGLHTVGSTTPYLYSYRLSDFPRTRSQANAPKGPVYSLRASPRNYGIAISGVADTQHVTIPVHLTSNTNGEGRQKQSTLRARPRATPLTLTAHVSIPDPSVAYRVYLYDNLSDVPTRDFNAQASRAIRVWTIPAGNGSTWSVTISTMSDQTRAFRAVPVTAP